MTEDEMVGWHHRLDEHEFKQALGVGDGQGSLVCCSPWGPKQRHDWASELNWLGWSSSFTLPFPTSCLPLDLTSFSSPFKPTPAPAKHHRLFQVSTAQPLLYSKLSEHCLHVSFLYWALGLSGGSDPVATAFVSPGPSRKLTWIMQNSVNVSWMRGRKLDLKHYKNVRFYITACSDSYQIKGSRTLKCSTKLKQPIICM